MIIRPEEPSDESAIGKVVRQAFAGAAHSSGTEALIVAALRRAGALTVSLVAIEEGELVGHIAASPVALETPAGEWFGLGPISVAPQWQRQGLGTALIGQALEHLRSSGAAGCVVLGEPSYYSRFGFEHDPSLTYRDVPPPYFQALRFCGRCPSGAVEYHAAFDTKD